MILIVNSVGKIINNLNEITFIKIIIIVNLMVYKLNFYLKHLESILRLMKKSILHVVKMAVFKIWKY